MSKKLHLFLIKIIFHNITEVRKTISSNTGKSNLELQGADDNDLEYNTDEELGENIEEFHMANSCTECISLQSFAPNW